jgi:hypothetical protein
MGQSGPGGPPLSVLCNLGAAPAQVPADRLPAAERDFLSGQRLDPGAPITLRPYEIRWVGTAACLNDDRAGGVETEGE